MACGVPVIVSNATSLPEVVGDAGVLVDPHNIQDITASMKLILTDANLRNSLIEKGLNRAQDFSIEKMGSRILKLIERLKGNG
jgi:glycosyltransferase involved in cell wall biosynthesis